MKKLSILTAVFLLLLFSCLDSPEDVKPYQTRKFYAQDFTDKSFYQVDAELLAQGLQCNVWVEKNSGVSESTARSIANAYDNNIYYKMMETFGEYHINYQGYSFNNTMSFADALADRDDKLCILVLDIKDNYKKNENDSYVSGYFWSGNLLDRNSSKYSNQCDMIYIDSNPGEPGSKESNTTLAHEMQHLMNLMSSILHREKGMDIWIDEGLSAAAEWLYTKEHPNVRWGWIGSGLGLIDKGNNFYVWGNREDENQYAIMDDYATVYIFFQWLRLQSGGVSIYNNIISSSFNDYSAVTNAAKAIDANYGTWSNLLRDWMAANYINSSSGRYGYMNDSELKQINAPAIASTEHIVSLYPGEGVYSITNSGESTPSSTANIKYAGLNKSSSQVNDSSVYPNGALLTYNIDTEFTYNENTGAHEGTAEPGTITGVAPAANINIASGGRSVTALLSGPFPIGAGDALRRSGKGDSFLIKDFKVLKTDAVNE